MKRALVLSGGGSRGAFECGAINYLINNAGLNFHNFFGSSVGSLNAAVLAQGANYSELVEYSQQLQNLWLGIRSDKDIYRKNRFRLLKLYKNSLLDPIGLRKIIQTNINPDKLISNRNSLLQMATVAIESGKLFLVGNSNVRNASDLLDYILASASIPLLFPAVEINQQHWYDGGLRDVTPLSAAFETDVQEIYVILSFPINQQLQPQLSPDIYRGSLPALFRSLEIMMNEISANDLKSAHFYNQNCHVFPDRREIPIYIIAPQEELENTAFDFNPNIIRTNIEYGAYCAENYIFTV